MENTQVMFDPLAVEDLFENNLTFPNLFDTTDFAKNGAIHEEYNDVLSDLSSAESSPFSASTFPSDEFTDESPYHSSTSPQPDSVHTPLAVPPNFALMQQQQQNNLIHVSGAHQYQQLHQSQQLHLMQQNQQQQQQHQQQQQLPQQHHQHHHNHQQQQQQQPQQPQQPYQQDLSGDQQQQAVQPSRSNPQQMPNESSLNHTSPATLLVNSPVSYMSTPEQLFVEDSDPDNSGKLNATNKRSKPSSSDAKPVKRNRKSADPNVSVGNTAVSLTREQLLNFSSEDFESFVDTHRAARTLTPVEEKEVKRQRRLIKNRESASASRQRKKEYVEVLEAHIHELKQEKSHLDMENQSLKSEVQALREQVGSLEKVLIQHNLLRELWQSMTSIRDKSQMAGAHAKAAGVCLLIVLFSFGLFFNNMGLGPRLPLPDVTTYSDAGNTRVLDAPNGFFYASQNLPAQGVAFQKRKLLELDNSTLVTQGAPPNDLWSSAPLSTSVYLVCGGPSAKTLAKQLPPNMEYTGDTFLVYLQASEDDETNTGKNALELSSSMTTVSCRAVKLEA